MISLCLLREVLKKSEIMIFSLKRRITVDTMIKWFSSIRYTIFFLIDYQSIFLSINTFALVLLLILFNVLFRSQTAYNIGRCHLLTEEWIIDTWKHRNQVDFDVNRPEFVSINIHNQSCPGLFLSQVNRSIDRSILTS